jgi:hypothetical protein
MVLRRGNRDGRGNGSTGFALAELAYGNASGTTGAGSAAKGVFKV